MILLIYVIKKKKTTKLIDSENGLVVAIGEAWEVGERYTLIKQKFCYCPKNKLINKNLKRKLSIFLETELKAPDFV